MRAPAQIAEWTLLGRTLADLCPEKFDEILEALRDTVGTHELLSPKHRALCAAAQQLLKPPNGN